MLAVGLALWALRTGNVTAEVVVLAAGVWVFILCHWLGRPEDRVLGTAPLLALSAWTALLAAGAMYRDWQPAVGGLLVAAAVLVVIGARVLAQHRRLARRFVWLAQGLGPATNDRRSPAQMLAPSWWHRDGMPVRWNYPAALTPDSKQLGEFEELAAARLGFPVKITWRPGAAVLDRRDEQEPATDGGDPLVGQLNEVLGAMIPGTKVTSLARTNEGAVESLVFSWPPARTSRVSHMAYRGRVALAVQDALGLAITVKWETHKFHAVVKPLAKVPGMIPHPPRDDTRPMSVVFGQFRSGTPCVWDLDGTLPHVLIVGGTGGGKTVLLMTLLTSLPQVDQVRTDIHVIDPKRVGLKGIHGRLAGVRKPATTPAAFVDTLQAVQDEMERRYTDLEADRITRAELTPVVLFVDEGQEMYDVLRTWWASADGKDDWRRRFGLDKPPTGADHPAMGMLGSILRLGREARVHVVLASQQAAASWLQTSSRGQFAVRIALRNLSVDDSRMVFGSTVATGGLEDLPGRAWVATGLGAEPQHAQIFWTPKVERGLAPADRAILRGLGVALPDDDETAEESPDQVSADQGPARAASVDGMSPSEQEPAALSVDAPVLRPDGDEVPVGAVEDGAQILVETDEGPSVATVESIDPDDVDPDRLAVTYRLADGALGVLSVEDGETLTVLE